MPILKVISVGTALAATVALAGCSSAKSISDGPTPGTPSAPPISGTQLTGSQLASAMLTGSDVPVSGFSAATGTDNNSGGSLTSAKAKLKLSTLSCADLQNALGEGGFGETAWSSNALFNGPSKEVLSETVYQFGDTAAANAFFTTLKARWNSCGTFTVSSQGSNAKLTVTVVTAKSGVGQQDFANTMTGTENGNPAALVSTVALDGPDVLMVGADKIGTTVPTDIDSGSLLTKLITKITAAG